MSVEHLIAQNGAVGEKDRSDLACNPIHLGRCSLRELGSGMPKLLMAKFLSLPLHRHWVSPHKNGR